MQPALQVGMTLPVMEPDLWEAPDTLERWARAIDEGPFSSLCFGERMAFDNPHALTLQRLDQGAEIAVAGKQDGVVQPGRKLHRIHRQFDIHVALDLSPTHRIDIFLGRLRDHAIAVIVQPIDEGTDRGIFLAFHQGGIVIGPHQLAPTVELLPQQLVIYIETKRLRGGVEIGSINEDGQPVVLVKHSVLPSMDLSCSRRSRIRVRGLIVPDRPERLRTEGLTWLTCLSVSVQSAPICPRLRALPVRHCARLRAFCIVNNTFQ